MNTIIEKKKFNILGNLFLISFLFYYYFPMEFGVILYSILLFFVLAQFNIKLKPIDFVLISITGILLLYDGINNETQKSGTCSKK